jgi:copper chaperone
MEKTFKVNGMHCKSCDMLVEDGLMDVAGITSVESNHKTGKVIVGFDESEATDEQIIAAIEAEGYEVE